MDETLKKEVIAYLLNNVGIQEELRGREQAEELKKLLRNTDINPEKRDSVLEKLAIDSSQHSRKISSNSDDYADTLHRDKEKTEAVNRLMDQLLLEINALTLFFTVTSIADKETQVELKKIMEDEVEHIRMVISMLEELGLDLELLDQSIVQKIEEELLTMDI
ncbi:hypothetical protein [Methanonatronarchaeum sp. AMET6-2]|uniref:hypothetical protein n=1 Tax=Methanonatronarchaeum sp. AMET6-2 TaxID=2933293 RepID=UPI0012001EEF|nr:hypothetical protein [Methanonatronarchaeum sp. AMET6-2]RZN63412.1 MAG: hypothetical protein EF811_00295 [Methanonatronarchaeia archaeon]UOY10078.1 hypothetical protein MU439_00075 [Methanonatronarchaeum sp. AMET6-2]